MKNIKYIICFYSLLFAVILFCSCSEKAEKSKIIFDTDFGGDADDLGALAMLNHFQNKGEIELMAIMCWNLEKFAISAIDATNTYFGNPDLLIATRVGDQHETPWNHSKVIADNLPYDASTQNVPSTTNLYRKILSESEDNSITIIAVGPLANIKALLESKSDSYSPLSGKELVHSKVKEFVIMGGNFPTSKNEWNFDGNMKGVTKYVLENIDVPITFSGAELGTQIRTGQVFNTLPEKSPLHLGFMHFSRYAPWMKHQYKGKIFDNATFDQTAVLYAVRNGVGHYWDRVENGICVADSIGGNTWVPSKKGKHSYLLLKMAKPDIETEIEKFMLGDF